VAKSSGCRAETYRASGLLDQRAGTASSLQQGAQWLTIAVQGAGIVGTVAGPGRPGLLDLAPWCPRRSCRAR